MCYMQLLFMNKEINKFDLFFDFKWKKSESIAPFSMVIDLIPVIIVYYTQLILAFHL